MSIAQLNWDHFYMLGYFDAEGRPFLSTWNGNLELISVVVLGATTYKLARSMWNAPVARGMELIGVPEGRDPVDFAREAGGLHAIGWLLPRKIERTPR